MENTNGNWTRPPGPPVIWRTIDAKEKLDDNTTVDVRLSIQGIPEDRHEEVLDHMCQYFHADEVLCKCLNYKSDKNAINDYLSLWRHYLKQGVSVGAFKLNSNGELGELIGMNVLFVTSVENDKMADEIMMNTKSSNVKKVFRCLHEGPDQIDIREIYGVDKYISEFGLSVKPNFRGQKVGVYLLEVWSDIGHKYGISIGSGTFTAAASQIQAARAGFKTLLDVKYAEFLDENGRPSFPNIEADGLKLMVKQL